MTSDELKVTSYEFTSYKVGARGVAAPRVTSDELRVMTYELRVTSYESVLEVSLRLGGGDRGRLARIPATWWLQLACAWL